MSDIIRVLRVIEYTGPRDKVENQVSRSLHGEKRLPNGVTIKAVTVGNYPEILEGLPVTENLPGTPPEKAYPKSDTCSKCGHQSHEGRACGEIIQTYDGGVSCMCGYPGH